MHKLDGTLGNLGYGTNLSSRLHESPGAQLTSSDASRHGITYVCHQATDVHTNLFQWETFLKPHFMSTSLLNQEIYSLVCSLSIPPYLLCLWTEQLGGKSCFFVHYSNLLYSSTYSGPYLLVTLDLCKSVFLQAIKMTQGSEYQEVFFFLLHHSQVCLILCRAKATFLLAQIIQKWWELLWKRLLENQVLYHANLPLVPLCFSWSLLLTEIQIYLYLQKGPEGKVKRVMQ